MNEFMVAHNIVIFKLFSMFSNQDGRVVQALDLSSNGRMSAWVRTPLLVGELFLDDLSINLLIFQYVEGWYSGILCYLFHQEHTELR